MSPAAHHTPGSFCWFELATTDQSAAKKFYSAVFGWAVNDSPMGPTEMYSMFQLEGKDAAAGYTLRPDQQAHGVPAHWMLYILSANVDAAAARAKTLGGTVVAEPFDVMDHGRMSIVQDPTGAMCAIWQAKTHTGTTITGIPGTAVWADLNTHDQVRGATFYADLFGWKMVEGKSMVPAKRGSYFHIVNGTEFIGGVSPAEHADPSIPPHWLIYFAVDDADHTIEKVTSLGGHVLMPTMVMEGIRKFAVLADPQGASFAIVESLPGGAEREAAQRPRRATRAHASPAARATRRTKPSTPKSLKRASKTPAKAKLHAKAKKSTRKAAAPSRAARSKPSRKAATSRSGRRASSAKPRGARTRPTRGASRRRR